MRVLVFDGPHQLRVDEREVPDPGPDEALIRVGRVGICGSDLHGYTGESGRRAPGMVMGHEASGWIERVGAEVSGLEAGEFVTFNPAIACDGSCGHRAANRCARLRVIGVDPAIQGAFADHIVVPASRVVPLGDMPAEWGAMVEPMAVGLQAVAQTEVAAGERLLVIGGGMIGQCVAQAAASVGAADITVVDLVQERRQLASEHGFRGVEPSAVAEWAPFNRAIDAVGVTATADMAIRSVVRGGTVGFVGLGQPEVRVPLFEVVVSERRIVGSFCYTDAIFGEAARRVADGSLQVDQLLGGVVGFEEARQAFEELANGERADAKVLVTTGAGDGATTAA